MIIAPNVCLSLLTKKLPEDQKDNINLIIYGCLVSASLIFAVIRTYGFFLVSLRSSERLHDKMVLAILQAPVLFFDSNPVGRILNRFSKDVVCLDELLPKTFLVSIQQVLVVFASMIVPTVTNPWLLFLVTPLIVLVLYISKYYLKTSRDLKRLESICRSPVFSHFSETLNGLDTIRTRRRQTDFVDQFYR
ncbi:multidrug resistance-associated protein 4-like [Orbicella faveolata]|uniref:multidrug resistance-associated protein 4-like n=1 Tax=Orbicella faveolata TaxID=48498 RepID=UPI0009E32163|nr:multidrug resistance-associated protein 4-like [Orbicella faveolata]